MLLEALMVSASRQWYLAELAKTLDKSPSSLQRELTALVRVGLLHRSVIGRKVYFQANVQSPFFTSLRDIVAVSQQSKGQLARSQ
jgi:DNA-binding IclR family transcriptional regulator